MKNRAVHIGTSGWSYADWKPTFYEGRPEREWLPYFTGHFDTVELNTTFYRLPPPAMVKRWATVTPPEFRFAVKAWKWITHMSKLVDSQDSLQRFYRAMEPLKEKTGVILLQLPGRMKGDAKRLEGFFPLLSKEWRYAIEFRHESWHTETINDVLRRHDIALCHYNWPDYKSPLTVTSDLVYLRFHGTEPGYHGSHSDAELKTYAEWLKKEKFTSAWVYFNNDWDCNAINNARTLREMLA